MNHSVTLQVGEDTLKTMQIGEEITVKIKGTVKSLRGGMSPEDMDKLDKARKNGDQEAIDWQPPSEVEIEMEDFTIIGKGRYADMADEPDEGEDD